MAGGSCSPAANRVPLCIRSGYLSRVETPDPRVNVNLRLRTSSRDRVDRIAVERDWDRAQTLRALLVLGLRAWDRGER
jgi:hypothetical protein